MLVEDWQFSWRECRYIDGIWQMKTCQILVKAGTLNDGASVPRILWSIVRPDGLIRGAALVHDVLFESRGMPNTTYEYSEDYKPVARAFSLKETNNLFGLIMRASNVHPFHRISARAGVAAGSWLIWNSYPDAINNRIQEYLQTAKEPVPVLVKEHLNEGYAS